MNKLLAIFIVLLPLCALADDSQLDERLNPVIETEPLVAINYKAYPGVKLKNNKIDLNGDDWSALKTKYQAALAGDSIFSIVYLGDSHVQADFGGAVLRQRMQARRPAGRGIIIPFRLAGTNQPLDYKITTNSPLITSKLMRTPWSTEMPFTGVGIQPLEADFSLQLHSDTSAKRLRIHSRGGRIDIMDVKADSVPVDFNAFVDDDGLTVVDIERNANDFDLMMRADGDVVIGGIELLAADAGIVEHSIGNNGATFSDYALINHFGSELANLHPDLVVVALGTNEAFGRMSVETLQNNIDNLLRSIKAYSPQTKILLVGPSDCYRRRGRRRRRVLVVNPRAATVAKGIRLYAESEHIPYYNFYSIAGSAASQRKSKLLSKDGVHFTATGYRLWGNLLSDALITTLEQ